MSFSHFLNNNSCVLKVAAGGKSILMTGDMGRVAEVKLIKAYGNDLKSDILVVPHHGSTTSSTRDFVNRVAPEFALFSVGYRNRYGFPKQKVITLLDNIFMIYHIPIFRFRDIQKNHIS